MVAQAVQTNPTARAGAFRAASADAAITGAAAARRPQISIGADIGERFSGGDRRGLRADPIVQITQLLYDGGGSDGRIAAAQSRLQQARTDQIVQAAMTVFDAVQAYSEVVRDRRLVDLARQNETLHQTFVDQTEMRLGAGAASETTLRIAQSRRADAGSRLVNATARLNRAEAVFAEVFDRAPGPLAPPRTAPTLKDATAASARSPRLLALDHAIDAAKAEIIVARAGRIPNLSLRAIARPESSGQSDIQAGLSVQYDLATGGERGARLLQAQANLDALLAERVALLRQFTRAVTSARSDLEAGSARIRAAREAVEANEASVALARAQFTIGRQDIAGLLDTQRDFIDASEAMIMAEHDQLLAGYVLLAVTGDILPAFAVSGEAAE